MPAARRLRFGPLPAPPEAAKPKRERVEKPKGPRVKVKIDPALVSKARELRDRYLERVNESLVLPAARAKYDVTRQIAGPVGLPLSVEAA
jgi:hypothetical protein